MFEQHLQNTLTLLQGNPVLSLGVAAVIAALFYFRPKDMLKLVGFCLLMVVVVYLIGLVAGTIGSGANQKDQMIYKTQRAIGE